jgi:outer membrane protein TolC
MRNFFVLTGAGLALLLFGTVTRGGEGEGTVHHKSWTEYGESSDSRSFTLDRAVLTALQQNPDILRAIQEIQRSKGVIIQIRAQALPQVTATGNGNWTDPKLGSGGLFSGSGGGTGGGGNLPNSSSWDYNIRILGTQMIFNYGTLRSIRGTFFQRDSAYFSFRNVLDQIIANVKTQFYQVVVDRQLIGVQEEQVQLLESQLKDQQNRFEAGTVPRFNVLQAQVALSNQIPNLITARNNYRIAKLTLAKTLGLDFDPTRKDSSPLEVIGEMPYTPRDISIIEAIELGKKNRPFLKQARANVYNQVEQVHVALGGFFPNVTASGGYEVFSDPITNFTSKSTPPVKTTGSLSLDDVSRGWIFGMQANWAIFDSGAAYGQVKQQRALLSETKITYDDDARQVELEIQQAYSNLLQNKELIQSQEKNVEQALEAVRLAKARLDAGAGTQLDVLNAQVQLATAESTKLQALFGYNSTLAEFDRVTGAHSRYTESFNGLTPPAANRKIYDTGSDKDATGDLKRTSR